MMVILDAELPFVSIHESSLLYKLSGVGRGECKEMNLWETCESPEFAVAS